MKREPVPIEPRRVSAGTRAKICSVVGCERHQKALGFCEMHYLRFRRRGTTDKMVTGQPRKKANRYMVATRPDHPLRTGKRSPTEYEHRIVFYDAHGAGPFACHVCGSSVGWDTMHVDHLNDDGFDNRLDNLRPACPPCNQQRGHHKMVATMRQKHSTLVTFRGETLPLIDWAVRIGIDRETLRSRLSRWPLERAMTQPRGPQGPQARKT